MYVLLKTIADTASAMPVVFTLHHTMKKDFPMKRTCLSLCLLLGLALGLRAQFRIDPQSHEPVWSAAGRDLLTAPDEGLWGVALGWSNNWMTDWKYARPEKVEQSGEWTVVSGRLQLPQGDLLLRDAYRPTESGGVECRRRFEWTGQETLHTVSLSVRLRLRGERLQAFLPGTLYYGNKNGARINAGIIPVYNGEPGELAVFEDHRYPMPFAMLESAEGKYAAAVHTTPSPVRGAVLQDQWWSLGVEAGEGYSDFVLYSGPIGYNRRHSVAKALQARPMAYPNTYLSLEPGRIVEKEFFVEVYPIEAEGTGFQRPVYTTLDRYRPYNYSSFDDFATIVRGKYRFALRRWISLDKGATGFDMYDPSQRREIVMGWCGQAEAPGYALQHLGSLVDDDSLDLRVQQSLDFLAQTPVDPATGQFPVGYGRQGRFGGDPVSCGQAMYSFARAIRSARKNRRYDTRNWEKFLRAACDGQSRRILADDWNPRSTAEAFLVAPLAISSRLFKEKNYRLAAEKAAQTFADRHLKMNGCYWGGTLDATCEDKEGAWAAFQAFLALYELTDEPKYLDWARHAMDVCLSYVVVWDIPMPPGRLADYRFRSTGWTVVSPQNQHIDVFGVFFSPAVYQMGVYLKDQRLKDLARVMFRSCYQLTDIYGSQGEQLQQTNFAQHGDMSNVYRLRGGYSEGWTVFWITAHFLSAAAQFVEMGVTP